MAISPIKMLSYEQKPNIFFPSAYNIIMRHHSHVKNALVNSLLGLKAAIAAGAFLAGN